MPRPLWFTNVKIACPDVLELDRSPARRPRVDRLKKRATYAGAMLIRLHTVIAGITAESSTAYDSAAPSSVAALSRVSTVCSTLLPDNTTWPADATKLPEFAIKVTSPPWT